MHITCLSWSHGAPFGAGNRDNFAPGDAVEATDGFFCLGKGHIWRPKQALTLHMQHVPLAF